MSYVNWEARIRSFANCNCAYGCPCQFNALPTNGNCEAVAGFAFDEGHFGDTRLEGLKSLYIARWPGPIHEGNGALQVIIDRQADAAQREALRKIMYGEETEPGSTMWNVFMSTIGTVYDPIYADVELHIDIDGRRAKMESPDQVQARGEPIRNPVTGAELRARLELPNGFEFKSAEFASGTSKTNGVISLDLNATHGHFANLHLSTHGVVD